MKKKILPAFLALLILYCLIFPQKMALAVADGLALWYHSILPTLLPFCVFSNIIICTGVYDRVFEKIHPVFRYIYPVRAPLIYPLVAGFLFGFPLGSKISAGLYKSGRISAREAELVGCISNNFGPAFLYNYVVAGLLEGKIPTWIMFLAFYAPPLLLGRALVTRLHDNGRDKKFSRENKKTAPESPISMKTLDAGIMDGFTTMFKLAGYILCATLLADILKNLPASNPLFLAVVSGAVEITNGIRQTGNLDTGIRLKAVLAVGMVNFGGLSGLMQSNSMMKSTGFRLRNYAAFRLACSITGVGMTCALFLLF